MASFFRVFGFVGQVLGMVRQNPLLLAPIALNILAAVPVSIVLSLGLAFVPDQYAQSVGVLVSLLGVTALYFIDYAAGGLTASLVYDQVTTGSASLGPAFGRTLRASPGILIFATVSAFLDLLSHVASQRQGIMRIVGPILMAVLRSIWTTATYVIMPALVVEQQGFFAAFQRSKQLMENDPTQVGVGYVGLGLVSWMISAASMAAAYALFGALANVSIVLAVLVFFTFVNVAWALSGYLKGVYYTCFYLWATQCERYQRADPNLAPAPLRDVMLAA